MADTTYSAKHIQVLEGLEPVRRRPGMYIGSTDIFGLHHLLTEIVDNSIDESLAGYAKNVWIVIWEDERHMAFLSRWPNTEGFSVVITKDHKEEKDGIKFVNAAAKKAR